MSRYITYHLRIKDSKKSLRKTLLEKASAVNYVWNFCNETQVESLRRHQTPKDWLSAFEFQTLTAGSGQMLGLSATSVQMICTEYATRRKQFKKSKLNWRSYKHSLPWLPFKASNISVDCEACTAIYKAKGSEIEFKFWKSGRPILGEIKTGSICADSRGRWYLNLTCEVNFLESAPKSDIGIDLGLKDAVTTSGGFSIAAPRLFRKYEARLGKAQRAKKKKLVRSFHAKIANARLDFNHKLSHKLASENSTIFIGDVSSSKLSQTNMAKSVYDVSWFQLKTFLKYKALARRSTYLEVSEKYSTQICSECGCIPNSSPKGHRDLSVREWVCSECGTKHNRDINAARNILRFGHEALTKLSRNKLSSTGNLGS